MDITSFFGTLATIGSVVSLLPQIVKTWKTKKADDLSWGMYGVLASATTSWLIYGYLRQDFPLTLTNAIVLVFTIITLFLKAKYSKNDK